MNKKWLLAIILVLTAIAITIILVLKSNTRYNKLVISNDEWNYIISNRSISTSINIENIEFNDYNLLIDNDNNVIYYSLVNSHKKYNPSIKYITNKKVKMAINKEITAEKLEQNNILKIMIYNDFEYRIYSLVVTNYPTLNVINQDNNKTQIELFDNHVDSPQKVLKSEARFKIIEQDKIYSFSLIKQSLGNNQRKNHMSIFGMEKRDEYILKKVNNINNNEKYIRLFIDNKYIGLYSFGPKERRIDNFERNKENNR